MIYSHQYGSEYKILMAQIFINFKNKIKFSFRQKFLRYMLQIIFNFLATKKYGSSLLGITNSCVQFMESLVQMVNRILKYKCNYINKEKQMCIIIIFLNEGRHCCLFCTVTSQEMQLPIEQQNNKQVRTLESLNFDLENFQREGGDVKKAKFFNNVIHKRYFNVPLDQVILE